MRKLRFRVRWSGFWVSAGAWVAKISPPGIAPGFDGRRNVTRRYALPIFRPDCRNLTLRIRSSQRLARMYLQRDMRACEVGLRSLLHYTDFLVSADYIHINKHEKCGRVRHPLPPIIIIKLSPSSIHATYLWFHATRTITLFNITK